MEAAGARRGVLQLSSAPKPAVVFEGLMSLPRSVTEQSSLTRQHGRGCVGARLCGDATRRDAGARQVLHRHARQRDL